MSGSGPVATVTDAGESVAGALTDVVSTGVGLARDIIENTADLADDLFHSAAGALGIEQKRQRRGLLSKLIIAVVALGVLAAVFSALRRFRGDGSSAEPLDQMPSPAAVDAAKSSNGTRDPAATPVG